MNSKHISPKILRIILYLGIVAVILGAADPLEGSIAIVVGSALISISTFLSKDCQWKKFLWATFMILIGVIYMFYVSSLGGFGGTSSRSWWWAFPILPYPVGWFWIIVLLLKRSFNKTSQTRDKKSSPNPLP